MLALPLLSPVSARRLVWTHLVAAPLLTAFLFPWIEQQTEVRGPGRQPALLTEPRVGDRRAAGPNRQLAAALTAGAHV
jgi:hypothetical protein